jgi:hypothetical protein
MTFTHAHCERRVVALMATRGLGVKLAAQALREPVKTVLVAVIDGHDRLVQTIERSEFSSVLNVLMSGDEAEANEVRGLQLLADRGGDNVTSRPVASRYGFSSHSRVRPALVRLQGRGLVDQRDGSWYIVDPLFAEWLRRASPQTVSTH